MYKKYLHILETLRDLPLLALRLVLAYGFYEPAMKKLGNIDAVSQWFASMNYPMPTFNAYLSGITEITGVIFLILGFGSRFITLPLIFVMIIATATVHAGNGFAAGNNGYEIPLYYMLMLFTLLVYGSGRISLDNILGKVFSKRNKEVENLELSTENS